MTRIIARNSAPISTNSPAELKKARIRNSTECTGLRAATTMTPDATATTANRKNMTACRIIAAIRLTPQSRRKPGPTVQRLGRLKSGPRLSPGLRFYLSSIGRLEGQRLGNLGFPAVAIGEQFVLVVEELFAGLGGEFEVRPLDDRIHRACLLAIAAIDAFGHIDVVAGGTPAAIVARLGLDRDRQSRADRLA